MRKYFFLFLLVFLYSCDERVKKERKVLSSKEIKITFDDFKQLMYKDANFLPYTKIDSVFIRERKLYVYVSDEGVVPVSYVDLQQKNSIILRNFAFYSFIKPSFSIIEIFYNIKNKDIDYNLVYSSSIEETQEVLTVFSNYYFNNIVNNILNLNKNYPKEHVLKSLNFSLANVISKENNVKLEWAGLDFFEFTFNTLLECKNDSSSIEKKHLDKVLVVFRGNEGAEGFQKRDSMKSSLDDLFHLTCDSLWKNPEKVISKKQVIM